MRASLAPLALVFLLAQACPGSLQNPERFTAGVDGGGGMTCDVEGDIFKNVCANAGCHDATTHQSNIDLATPGMKARIKAATAECTSVIGQPLGTFMIAKVKPNPSCGSPMPVGFPMLDADEIKCLEDYIKDGGLP
jgi:hypothetical protein